MSGARESRFLKMTPPGAAGPRERRCEFWIEELARLVGTCFGFTQLHTLHLMVDTHFVHLTVDRQRHAADTQHTAGLGHKAKGT